MISGKQSVIVHRIPIPPKWCNSFTDPLLNTAGQVDNRHVCCGNTESHSSQFAVEAWNHFSDGLGGSSGRRDDVNGGRSTTSPVLVARPVDRLLCGRVRVDGRHQALDDVVFLVDDFGQWRQTVGRTRRVATINTNAIIVYRAGIRIYQLTPFPSNADFFSIFPAFLFWILRKVVIAIRWQFGHISALVAINEVTVCRPG